MDFKKFLNETPIDFTGYDSKTDYYPPRKKYLKKYNKKLVGYHGTDIYNFWNIVQHGIKNTPQTTRYGRKGTFFSFSPDRARHYGRNGIVFVVEIPGNLVVDTDDIETNSFIARNTIKSGHITGVIYPPEDGKITPIKDFIRQVQQGQHLEIPKNTNTEFSVGVSSETDFENYLAEYLGHISKVIGLAKWLNEDDHSMKTNLIDKLGRYSYDRVKNFRPVDWLPFFQKLINYYLKKGFKGIHPMPKLTLELFKQFDDVPLSQAIEPYKKIYDDRRNRAISRS